MTRLKQFLEVMVEAAKSSLKQNSMPLPPWRSYAYLQAKWGSPYKRKFYPENPNISQTVAVHHHMQCPLHLKQLKSALQSEIDVKRVFRPINTDNRMLNLERWRHPFRALWDAASMAKGIINTSWKFGIKELRIGAETDDEGIHTNPAAAAIRTSEQQFWFMIWDFFCCPIYHVEFSDHNFPIVFHSSFFVFCPCNVCVRVFL